MAEEKKKRKKLSEKQVKIIIAIIIVVIIVGIIVWGMVPDKIYEVSELLDDPDKYDGNEVSLTGVVKNWDSSSVNFTLGDAQDENLVLNITHEGLFPENFGINATVTITGVFHKDMMRVESKKIVTGCPSKY